jgi:CelD/BcsL family acetyltransferase involved in cellulose biosynthesis
MLVVAWIPALAGMVHRVGRTRLQLEIHTAVSTLAADWDSLAARVEAPPFLRPGWAAAWWEAFGTGRLEIVAIRRRGRLVAVLPLSRRGVTLHSLANDHTPLGGPLAEDGQATQALGRALKARRVAQVVLEWVDAESPQLRSSMAAMRARVITRAMDRSPYVALREGGRDIDRRLTAKRRSNLRRLRRRLEATGAVALDVRDGRDGLDALLDEGFRLEGAAWKDACGTSILACADARAFYTAIARWAAAQGLLRLAFLRLDGEALAFDYCLEDATSHYLLKTGYAPAHRSEAPAILLREEMIRRAAALDLESYEFLGSNPPWKREWTDACHVRSRVRAYPRAPAGTTAWAVRRYGTPIAKRACRVVGPGPCSG